MKLGRILDFFVNASTGPRRKAVDIALQLPVGVFTCSANSNAYFQSVPLRQVHGGWQERTAYWLHPYAVRVKNDSCPSAGYSVLPTTLRHWEHWPMTSILFRFR